MDATPKPGNVAEAHEQLLARERLATLPGFTSALADAARFTRLVGMTNRVYEVEAGGERLCLRIPGSGTAAMIDRRAEEVNARAAAKAGVAPEVLYFGEDGVMLTRFIEAEPLLPARLRESAGALERCALAFGRLHTAEIVFAGTFDAFSSIESYVAILARPGAAPSSVERGTIDKVRDIGRVLAAQPSLAKPCHCDPTGRNLLDTGARVWLVDWEYSGMNDPMWDLAYFSIESRLEAADDDRLLRAYFGGAPDEAEAARMALLKPVSEVLAALWALIQVAEGATSGDFSGYAKATFARAAERMRAPDFPRHLEELRKG